LSVTDELQKTSVKEVLEIYRQENDELQTTSGQRRFCEEVLNSMYIIGGTATIQKYNVSIGFTENLSKAYQKYAI